MLFNELGKMKRSSIMTSIILMAVGVIMVVCPQQYVSSVVNILGYAMVIIATVLVLNYISSTKTLMNYILMTCALAILIGGIAVLVFNNGDTHVLRILSWLFGILLILDGGHTVLHALIYARRAQRKGWWVLVILGGLLVFFGIILLVNLSVLWWNTPKGLMMVIGGFTIYSSLVGILRMLWVWPIRNEKEG